MFMHRVSIDSDSIHIPVAETFYTNPQYRVTIDEPDDDDEDGLGTIIVGLMQKERRKMRADGKSDLTIGYAIYQVHYGYNAIC